MPPPVGSAVYLSIVVAVVPMLSCTCSLYTVLEEDNVHEGLYDATTSQVSSNTVLEEHTMHEGLYDATTGRSVVDVSIVAAVVSMLSCTCCLLLVVLILEEYTMHEGLYDAATGRVSILFVCCCGCCLEVVMFCLPAHHIGGLHCT
jgi:hypothetical protein